MVSRELDVCVLDPVLRSTKQIVVNGSSVVGPKLPVVTALFKKAESGIRVLSKKMSVMDSHSCPVRAMAW